MNDVFYGPIPEIWRILDHRTKPIGESLHYKCRPCGCKFFVPDGYNGCAYKDPDEGFCLSAKGIMEAKEYTIKLMKDGPLGIY